MMPELRLQVKDVSSTSKLGREGKVRIMRRPRVKRFEGFDVPSCGGGRRRSREVLWESGTIRASTTVCSV